jgi:hypothetical protein
LVKCALLPWIEQLPYISPIKKAQLHQFENLGEAIIQSCLKLIVSNQKHGDSGSPTIRHHSVFSGSKKALYLKVLHNPFNKQFYLPLLPVDICNSAS